MHVITRTRLSEFWRRHRDAENPLRAWYRLARAANWSHFADLKQDFPSADQVGRLVVFNVAGNKYRLIAYLDYAHKMMFIREVLTRPDYSRGRWKDDPWF
jgi:mRNA interferase HigB